MRLIEAESFKTALGCSVSILAMAAAHGALAQQRAFNLPAQEASRAISQFARQAQLQITAPADQLKGVRTAAIVGELDARVALRRLIAGTNLAIASDSGDVVVL